MKTISTTERTITIIDNFFFETRIRFATKIIKNQGQFFLLLKRMQRRCIGEAKKKKIIVLGVERRA